MGKKDKAHRARVARRNLKQEADAWAQWDTIQENLKAKGYNSIEEAIEKEPDLAPVLLPFALRAYKLSDQNMKKYGDGLI